MLGTAWPYAHGNRRALRSGLRLNGSVAKLRVWALFQAPQRVFEYTPLVPGSPSLDARSRSPGGTRRSNCRFKIVDFRLLRGSPTRLSRLKSQIGNRQSEI